MSDQMIRDIQEWHRRHGQREITMPQASIQLLPARIGSREPPALRGPLDAPPPKREQDLWLKITANTEQNDEHFKWDYTVSGHAFPGGPALWTNRQARNSIEFHNIATWASGYAIDAEADCPIIGVEPAPNNIYVRGWGPYMMTETQWFYAFEWPNVPTVESASGSGVESIDGGTP